MFFFSYRFHLKWKQSMSAHDYQNKKKKQVAGTLYELLVNVLRQTYCFTRLRFTHYTNLCIYIVKISSFQCSMHFCEKLYGYKSFISKHLAKRHYYFVIDLFDR